MTSFLYQLLDYPYFYKGYEVEIINKINFNNSLFLWLSYNIKYAQGQCVSYEWDTIP
jgi:hypothetical protein